MDSIKLFGLALGGQTVAYNTLVFKGLKAGYIVDNGCSTVEVEAFLDEQAIDISSTFYKTWDDIIKKDRYELFIDQIVHYASTYGTNFEGPAYIPNSDYASGYVIEYKNYKVIKKATAEEIIEKCYTMLSGVALKKDTIDAIMRIFSSLKHTPDISRIKNKEAIILVSYRFGLSPTNAEDILRLLIFTVAGETLLIKDKKTIQAIKNSYIDISNIINKNANVLAGCFLRHKNLFLAFKHTHKNNARVINNLRKLAKKYHKPLPVQEYYNADIDVNSLTNFKKVSILEGILNSEKKTKIYNIRNGKFWIKSGCKDSSTDGKMGLFFRLAGSLTASIKEKHAGKKFYIPEGVNIACPKSEKAFIGAFPSGTSIDRTNSTVIGINWREGSGLRDLDLSFIDENLNKIGWNANYKAQGFVYSGDITSANPEATEMIKLGNIEGLIQVNRFGGEENGTYKIFIGEADEIKKNKMIDNIIIQSDAKSTGREQIIGISVFDRVILQSIIASDNAVSSGNTVTSEYINYYSSYKFLNLNDVLVGAGLIKTNKEDCDIDMSNLSKDTIIELFN